MERVRVVDGDARLVGSRCGSCGHATFPRRERCPSCGAVEAMAETMLGGDGIVQSSVELFVSTEECEAPYTLGLVRLDDGVTLLARIAGAGGPGERVQLVADDQGFWFAAVAHAADPRAPTIDERTPE